ncbi:MAG: DUF2484 family protein [Paracoccaceae bacterium]
MSLPLILACLWVVAGAGVAMLPMRLQFVPGFALLLAAPVLIIWIGAVHGWIWSMIGVLAFVSMFRRPLGALARHLMRRWG